VTRTGHTPSLTLSESLAVVSKELLRLEDIDDQPMLFDGPEIHTDIGVSCIETEIVSESMEEVDIKQVYTRSVSVYVWVCVCVGSRYKAGIQ